MAVRAALLLLFLAPSALRADIYSWRTGEVIPGTEGIDPGPGVQLDHRDLAYADFTDAIVAIASFTDATSNGFSPQQLYSTASYRAKNLNAISLGRNDLVGWDFSGQKLSHADLSNSNLTGATLANASLLNANLSDSNLTLANLAGAELDGSKLTNGHLTGANLSNASLGSSALANADLSRAVVTGTNLDDTTSHGFTPQQLYSTQSYLEKNLRGVGLGGNDLSDWDFTGQDLTNANLSGSNLTNVNLSDAVVTGASFG